MPISEQSPTLSTSLRNKPTLKEKLRRVRRELVRSFRMDRSPEPQPDIIPSPFQPDDEYHADSETFFSDSPPYHPPTADGESDVDMEDMQLDGPVSMFGRKARQSGPPVAAIFVHAGAGYHSTTNEQYHLGACNE